MKIYLISFGSRGFENALKRLRNEAIESKFFDEIILYEEKDIFGFLEYHSYFIENNPRGFGCWIWKPHIVLKTLNKIDQGDIIVYLDSGFTINSLGKNRFNEYIDLCISSEFKNVSFMYEEYMENQYTKQDVFNFLNLSDKHKKSGQLIGGCFIIQKCDFTLNLIERYFYTSMNYNLINNKSYSENEKCFIEHRNDQSIFSCLRKQFGTHIIENECDISSHKKEDYMSIDAYKSYPFWATRFRF